MYADVSYSFPALHFPFLPVSDGSGLLAPPGGQPSGPGGLAVPNANNKLIRSQSRAFLSEDGLPQPIEYFIASDASAVIEHTKRVLYLEDDDIAHISEGGE